MKIERMSMIEQTAKTIASLRSAKTIMQILGVELPAKVYKFENATKFRACFERLKAEGRVELKANNDKAIVREGGEIEWTKTRLPEIFHPIRDKVIEVERLSHPDGILPAGMKMVFNSGVNLSHAVGLHADQINQPTSRVYVFRPENPTLCVSHEETLIKLQERFFFYDLDQDVIATQQGKDLLKRAFALDKKAREQNPDLVKFFEDLEALAVPADEMTLTVLSGLTLHKKSPVETDGAFFRAAVWEPPASI